MRKMLRHTQTLRSAAFAAARSGNAEKVKKCIYEDEVDAAGGEIKNGCESFVDRKPNDPSETLLHIAAKMGNADLMGWLDTHGELSSYIWATLPLTLFF
jgi:hypothetical protein